MVALVMLTAMAAADFETVTYATVDGRELKADVYRAVSLARGAFDGPWPVVVLVHGGGWQKGDKEKFTGLAKALHEEGFGVVNIEYRLSGEAKFPAALHDVKQAIAWTRANAGRFGFDPKQVAAVGGSAGGHLVALAAATPGELNPEGFEEDASLDAVIVMGGGVDQVKRAKTGGSVPNAVLFFGGTYEEVPEVYATASPITHVAKDHPPVLFLDGGKDRPGERYIDIRPKLDAVEVRNELRVVPDAKHGAWNREPYRSKFVAEMAAFLRETFAERS